MKRVVLLVLAALLLMWGGVLLGPPERGTRVAPPEPAAAAEGGGEGEASERAAAPEPSVEAAAPEAQPPSAAAEPLAAAAVPAERDARAHASNGPMGRAELVRTARAVAAVARPVGDGAGATDPDELLGELGEGARSPDFVRLETDYTSEPRDGAWARTEERRIADLFAGHPLGRQLTMMNCQDSVCRIVLETQSKDAFEQLLEVPGLSDATGLSSQTPYSLRSGQLSVYYRRADAAQASKTQR